MAGKAIHTSPFFLLLLLLFFLLFLTPSSSASAAHPSYGDAGASCASAAEEVPVPAPVRREVYDGGRIIDISHRYVEDMPSWESDNGLGQFLWLQKSMKNGSLFNGSEFKLPSHTGTHVDAPGHVFQQYFEAGYDVDTLDLAVLNGPALLVDVPRDKNITAEVMKSLGIPKGIKRVLFRTLNTDSVDFHNAHIWKALKVMIHEGFPAYFYESSNFYGSGLDSFRMLLKAHTSMLLYIKMNKMFFLFV